MQRDVDASPGGLAAPVAALGVVFGDIGTSPLYAMRAVLHEPSQLDPAAVYGLTSTVIWSLTLVVTVLYVGILLGSDNDGEGGLLALVALLRRTASGPRAVAALTLVGAGGACLFLGDSVVTPAISVLSAAEGLRVADSSLESAALPAAAVVLAGVFVLQRIGSGRIGRLYGPLMLCWFLVVATTGGASLLQHPGALRALSPYTAVRYFVSEPRDAFVALGAVVLAITGAEALYADLGHFGRPAITKAWLGVVFPCLVLGYLGEAGAVADKQAGATDPFYAVVPGWAVIPVLVLATLATVIASQAVIAGAFTVMHQAGGLGLWPALRTRHPSPERGGQIYLPAANWTLGIAVLAVVIGFGSSAALASAYGVAVSATILVTTGLAVTLTWLRRERLLLVVILGLQVVTVAFVVATSSKILSGGWLPVVIAVALFTAMATWRSGHRRLAQARQREEPLVAELLEAVGEVRRRQPGAAVFLTDDLERAPFALRVLLEHEHVLHERVVLLGWHVDDRPAAQPHESSVRARSIGGAEAMVAVEVTLGYRDRLDVGNVLRRAVDREPALLNGVDSGAALFFVSDPLPQLSRSSPMPTWQQRLFVVMDRLATGRVEQLALPYGRTVIIGREYPL